MRGKMRGPGGDGIDIEPLTASPEEVLEGQIFYGEGSEEIQTGIMPNKLAVETSPKLEGLEDLLRVCLYRGGYIREGSSGYPEVNIPYPDLARAIKLTADIIRNETKVAGVTGTYGNDGNLTSETLVKNKIGYGAKGKVVGTATNWGSVNKELLAGERYDIAKGYYEGGTVKAKNLKDQTPGNATAADILKGKTAWVYGTKITGNIVSKTEEVFNVRSSAYSDRTISAATYLSGTQTIKGVYTEGISASNIKKDVWAKVGDSDDNGRIVSAKGTLEGMMTLSGRWLKGTLTLSERTVRMGDTTQTIKYASYEAHEAVVNQVILSGNITLTLLNGEDSYPRVSGSVKDIGVIIGFGGYYYKQASGSESDYTVTARFLRSQTIQIGTR